MCDTVKRTWEVFADDDLFSYLIERNPKYALALDGLGEELEDAFEEDQIEEAFDNDASDAKEVRSMKTLQYIVCDFFSIHVEIYLFNHLLPIRGSNLAGVN